MKDNGELKAGEVRNTPSCVQKLAILFIKKPYLLEHWFSVSLSAGHGGRSMFVRVQTEGQQSPRHHGRSYLTPYHYRGLNWESECCLKTSKIYYASPCLIFSPFSVPTCFPPLLLHFPHLPSVFIIFNFYLPSASFICPLFKMTSLLKKGERVKVNLGKFLGKIR